MTDSDDFLPSEMAELIEAMPMMAALGLGGTIRLDQLLKDRPDIARRLEQLEPVGAAATFGGLLTVPDLQANAARIEALVHLALALGKGRQRISDKLAAKCFAYLGEGLCGALEDPAEDMFVGAVRTPWGNFRILEGIWEGNAFFLQIFVNVVAKMPKGPGYDDIRARVLSLLRLSDLLCARTKLDRFQLGAEMPTDKLPPRKASPWLLRRRHLRFTETDLEAAGIDPDHLRPFAFDMNRRADLATEEVGSSTLERTPLAVVGNTVHLVLPTAVSAAIRYYLVAEFERSGLTPEFRSAIARSYSELFKGTPLLGGRRPPMLGFAEGPHGSFAETVAEVDKGRYIHFLFYTDAMADLDETGLAGVNPDTALVGEEFDRRIRDARNAMAKREGFRGGLTLIVGCGIGRGAAVVFGEEDVPDWQVEFCSAYDFITLSWTPGFKPLKLWRLLEAKERTAELNLRLHNLNGLVNLVAWAREHDGHIVPHGRMPDELRDGRSAFLAIDQNRQRMLRHEVALAQDERVEQFLDGRWLRLRRDQSSEFADDQAAPLYGSEDVGPSGMPMSAFRAPNRTWWANVESSSDAGGYSAYEQWRLIAVWLQRSAPLLDAIEGLPAGPILWDVTFDSLAADPRSLPPTQTYEKAKAAIRLDVDPSRRTIAMQVGNVFAAALFHPENIAERALVATLVRSAAELAGHADPDAVSDALTPHIIPGILARQGHVLLAHGFRDHVRPDLKGRTIIIEQEDDAYTRLGLCWAVRDRALGSRIEGKDDCTAFLNALVRHLEEEVIGDLRTFARPAMLELLLRNHERALVERDHWRRTSAAMIALHGETPETFRTIADHEFKLNAVFQATRNLVEIAVCESPLEGGLRPGTLDLGLLMAKATMLFEMGGWSDAIRWDLMQPELRLTPLGDVHANLDFHEEVVLPHARLTAENRISDDADSYADHLEDRPPEITVAHRIEAEFADAFTEQFGATIDQMRIFIDFVENLGVTTQKAILTLPRSRFRNIEAAGQPLDDVVAEKLLDVLTLRTRAAWRDVPDGFNAKDIHPWRFRRRISILRRPLLQIDDEADPTILVAPGMVRDGFMYMIGNFYRGDFADNQLSPKMLRWKARKANTRGAAFTLDVAAALEAAGWQTATEVAMTKLMARGLDRDYGDVDVLAWRESDGRVLAIECKDVQYRKTYGEIAEQLADFRGVTRSNGRDDYLRKHLVRMGIIRTYPDAVSKFTGVKPLSGVESHLMFRYPVPMEFALRKMAEKVKVSRFDSIGDI